MSDGPASDPMYPNQGDHLSGSDLEAWSPETPTERTEQEKQELLDIASSAKVINEVIEWFDKNIEFYGNLDSIETFGGDEKSLQLALNVAKGMQAQFRSKKREFVNTYNALLKEKENSEQQS